MKEDNIYNEMARDEAEYMKDAEKELICHHKYWANEIEENIRDVKSIINRLREFTFHKSHSHDTSLRLKRMFRDIAIRLSVIETISKDMQ